jgi:hypothetical protein
MIEGLLNERVAFVPTTGTAATLPAFIRRMSKILKDERDGKMTEISGDVFLADAVTPVIGDKITYDTLDYYIFETKYLPGQRAWKCTVVSAGQYERSVMSHRLNR